MPPPPGRRVVVVGTSGSGKTTLGRLLAQRLDVRHIELDSLHWEPGWREAEVATFRARVEQAVADDGWVLDGNYSKVRDIVWSRADTIVWLDFPLTLILRRLLKRTASRMARRTELWNGNRESLRNMLDWDNIIFWAIKSQPRHRREYPQLFQQARYRHLRLIHLRSPRELKAWLESMHAPAG